MGWFANISETMHLLVDLIDTHFGQDMFVVCPGTSLLGFDYSRLDGKITVAVNDQVFHMTPTYHLFNDGFPACARYCSNPRSWQQPAPWQHTVCSRPMDWEYSKDTKIICRECSYTRLVRENSELEDQIFVYWERGPDVRKNNHELWCDNTSLTAAIMFCWKCAAEHIYLLGFDSCNRDEFIYHYMAGCPPMPQTPEEFAAMKISMRGQHGKQNGDMRIMKEWFEKEKLYPTENIINLSPITTCSTWPRKKLEEVL